MTSFLILNKYSSVYTILCSLLKRDTKTTQALGPSTLGSLPAPKKRNIPSPMSRNSRSLATMLKTEQKGRNQPKLKFQLYTIINNSNEKKF